MTENHILGFATGIPTSSFFAFSSTSCLSSVTRASASASAAALAILSFSLRVDDGVCDDGGLLDGVCVDDEEVLLVEPFPLDKVFRPT